MLDVAGRCDYDDIKFMTEVDVKTPQELIKEICDAGFRQADIMRETTISRAGISRLSKGRNQKISYASMASLEAAHKKFLSIYRKQQKELSKKPVVHPDSVV